MKGIETAIDADGRVISIKDQGITPIPPKGFVYSIDPCSPLEIPPTYEGELAQCEFIPLPQNEPENSEAWEEMEYVVGGTPVLISNGEVITDFTQERTIETFLTKQHPRTAIGILPNGHWIFVIVEGKLPEISLGMTMNELTSSCTPWVVSTPSISTAEVHPLFTSKINCGTLHQEWTRTLPTLKWGTNGPLAMRF